MEPWSRDLSGCTFPLNRQKNAGRERSGEKHSCSTLHNPRVVWIWIEVIWISLKPWSSVSLRVYTTSQQRFLCPVSSLIIRRGGGGGGGGMLLAPFFVCFCCDYFWLCWNWPFSIHWQFLAGSPRWITLSTPLGARPITPSADKGSVTFGLSHHQRLSWLESSASVWWQSAQNSVW